VHLLGKHLHQSLIELWLGRFAHWKSSYFEQKPHSNLCWSVENKEDSCHPNHSWSLFLLIKYARDLWPRRIRTRKSRNWCLNRLGSNLRQNWRKAVLVSRPVHSKVQSRVQVLLKETKVSVRSLLFDNKLQLKISSFFVSINQNYSTWSSHGQTSMLANGTVQSSMTGSDSAHNSADNYNLKLVALPLLIFRRGGTRLDVHWFGWCRWFTGSCSSLVQWFTQGSLVQVVHWFTGSLVQAVHWFTGSCKECWNVVYAYSLAINRKYC